MQMPVRRHTILSLAVLLMLLISFADAFSLDMPGIQKDVANYNSKVDNAPTILKSMLGSEKINLIVTRDNGSIFQVGMDVVSARIERTVEGGYSDPTIIITTTESAINEVVRSKDRIAAFQETDGCRPDSFRGKKLVGRGQDKGRPLQHQLSPVRL